MANGGKHFWGSRTGRSLNLLLWFLFSIFTLIIVAICVTLQNLRVGRNYREQALKTLRAAEKRIVETIEREPDVGIDDTESVISQIAYELGVSSYLVYGDTRTVIAYYGAERDYSDFETLPELLSGATEPLAFIAENDLAYATLVNLEGRECYLYLSISISLFQAFEVDFRWISLITGLLAVVLAFIVSGIISSLVTRPVVEVTERAKELARGNFNFNFKKDYYCLEIAELSDALEYARVEISKADRMQKELIANVSHDFKTPLTMIKAYASMIREISGDNKEKREAHAQIIIDEADRLAALVTDVLDLSKLHVGTENMAFEEFDLSEVTCQIAARFAYLKDTQGYVIETAIEEGLLIRANRARVEQVIYNLIGNAVNYTGTDKRVRVKLFQKERAARLEVIDSGKGIPPDEVDTIWGRYYRSEQSHKRPVQGTGLGLSIVKGILLAHGVPFGVISEVGKGSCFWVEFPPPTQEEKREKQTHKKRKEGKT